MEVKGHKSDELISWSAPYRPYKKRDKSFYITAGILGFLLIVIALFIREWLLVAAIFSVVFVSYVLAAVPPHEITYKITKKGMWVDEVFYKFEALLEYWFEHHLESTVLVLIAVEKQPIKLQVVVPEEKKEDVNSALSEHVVYRETPLKSAVDKAADWLKLKFPLEDKKAHHAKTA